MTEFIGTGENKVYRAIGLMSGTSLDGIDAALVETDGHALVRPLGFVTIPYDPAERETIRACFGTATRDDPRLAAAERLLTLRHAAAVHDLLSATGFSPADIDLIGFHGQTVHHAPGEGVTVQIGDARLLSAETGIDVVSDFRQADVASGGEGAPLAPLYHQARCRSSALDLPCAILNIGGVANVTWVGDGARGGDGTILAFDTGPGNALIDDFVAGRTGAACDVDGALAARGRVDHALLKCFLSHDYFDRKPPKSLDRDQWRAAALMPAGISDADGAATLAAFTVDAVARGAAFFPTPARRWYVCGGGRHNASLMRALSDTLGVPVAPVEDIGWNGDALEAECFAFLAVRSVLGLPLSLPSTTGVPQPTTGGILTRKA